MAADDRRYMREALRRGRRGLGRTSPNPPVGAVVVRRGIVVGRGHHRRAGAAHGEAEALENAGAAARGATLYVTLEPCAHTGRTPPCTEAILAAGVRRVVFGCRDPNPAVRGGGAALLRRRGVAVDGGVLAEECEDLVRAFRKAAVERLPWVTVKLAASIDGRIATAGGDSRWVTGAAARGLVHRLRDTHDAVLVGAETVRRDDPALTCRAPGGRDPVRAILDGRLRAPLTARVLRGAAAAGTIVFAARPAPARKAAALRRRGVTLVERRGRGGVLRLRGVLQALADRGLHSVLVEGGGEVAAALLRERLVDRLLLFYAPVIVGGDGRPMIAGLGTGRMSEALGVEVLRSRWVGTDFLIEARPRAAGQR